MNSIKSHTADVNNNYHEYSSDNNDDNDNNSNNNNDINNNNNIINDDYYYFLCNHNSNNNNQIIHTWSVGESSVRERTFPTGMFLRRSRGFPVSWWYLPSSPILRAALNPKIEK